MSRAQVSELIEFQCPDCKGMCRLSEKQRALQHSDPTCKTWRAHRGKAQDFLKLAFLARGGAALNLGKAELHPVATEREKADLIEQLNEGFKKL